MSFTLDLADGGFGDADGAANGIIVVGSSGLGFASASEGGGGTPVPPSVDDGGGGCFIAIAAYSSQVEPPDKVLCEFRDHLLLNNSLGKAFVDLYYTCSPPTAEFIASHDPMQLMVRWSLLPI
jgi:hypothetical protein